jgi:predicted Na+-dependent transporter
VLTIVGVWAAIRPAEARLGWLLNSLGRAGAVGRIALFVLVPLVLGLVIVARYGDLALVALVPLTDTLVSLSLLTVLVGRTPGCRSHRWVARCSRSLSRAGRAGL